MDLPDRFHFCTRRTVEFADTDMAGIVYFTHFLRYAATAEHGWGGRYYPAVIEVVYGNIPLAPAPRGSEG